MTCSCLSIVAPSAAGIGYVTSAPRTRRARPTRTDIASAAAGEAPSAASVARNEAAARRNSRRPSSSQPPPQSSATHRFTSMTPVRTATSQSSELAAADRRSACHARSDTSSVASRWPSLPQRGAVAEQEDEEPHLDPEDRRGGEGLHVGQEEEDPAQEGHREADEHGSVHGVELRQVHATGVGVRAPQRERPCGPRRAPGRRPGGSLRCG